MHVLLTEPFNYFFSLFHIFNLDLFLYILQDFKWIFSHLIVIGTSDAQATSVNSTLIAIISLSIAYILKYFTLLLT